MDGYAFPSFARFLQQLARLGEEQDYGASTMGEAEAGLERGVAGLFREYGAYRLGLCVGAPASHPLLLKLVVSCIHFTQALNQNVHALTKLRSGIPVRRSNCRRFPACPTRHRL